MPDTAATNAQAPGVTLTESAARRIAFLAAQESQPGMMLRISVSGGGCSGFQYGFAFDDSRNDDDRLFERAGAKVVIDETSLELLAGAEIDFVEDLIGASFQIRNPNAKSSCGCGNSFAV
jgi:iron-sulfur cluster insertion protein